MTWESVQTLLVTMLFGLVCWFARAWKEDVDKNIELTEKQNARIAVLEAALTNQQNQQRVIQRLDNILGLLGGTREEDATPVKHTKPTNGPERSDERSD